MATSQLGNHCKSKREGDIKGMNDEERKGGQREMRREVKTKRKGEERRWKQNQCVYVRGCVCVAGQLFILPVDSLGKAAAVK